MNDNLVAFHSKLAIQGIFLNNRSSFNIGNMLTVNDVLLREFLHFQLILIQAVEAAELDVVGFSSRVSFRTAKHGNNMVFRNGHVHIDILHQVSAATVANVAPTVNIAQEVPTVAILAHKQGDSVSGESVVKAGREVVNRNHIIGAGIIRIFLDAEGNNTAGNLRQRIVTFPSNAVIMGNGIT